MKDSVLARVTRLVGGVALLLIVLGLLGCATTRLYTVQAGDTLQSIAQKNNTTVATLIDLNKSRYPQLESNPKTLRAGWELLIPTDSDTAVEIEALLVRLARAASPPSTPAPPVPAAPNQKINDTVHYIFEGINNERSSQKLKPLTFDANLNNIAQVRSNDMISRQYFSHTDPKTGQVLFQVLLREQGYTYFFAGENIAEIRNQGTFVPTGFTVYARYSAQELADQFVTGWINSPEHYENIVNPHFRRTGVALGVSLDGTRVVATQVFSD